VSSNFFLENKAQAIFSVFRDCQWLASGFNWVSTFRQLTLAEPFVPQVEQQAENHASPATLITMERAWSLIEGGPVARDCRQCECERLPWMIKHHWRLS
jgi:hypothetical protein